jgi:hypothetical protein
LASLVGGKTRIQLSAPSPLPISSINLSSSPPFVLLRIFPQTSLLPGLSLLPRLGPSGCRRKGRLRWAGGVQNFPELFQIGKYLLPLSPGFLQDSHEPSGVILLIAVNPDNITGKNEFAGQDTLPGQSKKIPKEHGASRGNKSGTFGSIFQRGSLQKAYIFKKKGGISGVFTCKEGITDSVGFRGRFNPES